MIFIAIMYFDIESVFALCFSKQAQPHSFLTSLISNDIVVAIDVRDAPIRRALAYGNRGWGRGWTMPWRRKGLSMGLAHPEIPRSYCSGSVGERKRRGHVKR